MRSLIIHFLRVGPQTARLCQTLFILLGLIFFALAPHAMAATINATASATDTLNGTDGQCSLREAIANINSMATIYADCVPTGLYGATDTINIPAGIYTISISGAAENQNASGDYDILKSVSIVGAGAGSTTISGGSLGSVFDLNASAVVASFVGVTITGGSGSGIRNQQYYNSTITVADSIISGNSNSGISNSGTLSVTNSTISGNSASVTRGGGIESFNGTVSVINSTITGNTTTGCGGGLYHWGGGTFTVTNSTISNNSGGGICGDGGSFTVTNSTISNNSGGGIYSWASTLTVTNSTITGNTTTTKGGGIYNDSGSFTVGVANVINSTISNNTAASGGGFITMAPSLLSIPPLAATRRLTAAELITSILAQVTRPPLPTPSWAAKLLARIATEQ